MTEKKPPSAQPSDLRKRAEEKLRSVRQATNETLLSEQTQRVLHELRVHQIELEMQNEELRRVQGKLEASQARYFDLYDLAPVSYVTVNEKGLIIEANLIAATLLGVARSALVKQPFSIFIHKEDQDIYYRHRKQLFETGKPQACEFRIVRKDNSQFWALVETTAAQDNDGAPLVRIVMSNITDRKQAEYELKKLNETQEQQVIEKAIELASVKEQLYHAQKMESVGRLAGGVAHDFNNKLMAIIGYANLAEMELENNNPARMLIQKLLESADKATKITQSLLVFSRKQPLSIEPVSLNNIMENVGTLLLKITRESVKYHLSTNAQDVTIMADADKLEQVLMNMVNNAVDAMPNGGHLTISTGVVELDHIFVKKHGLDKAGPYGTITISDTGIGMDEETKSKIFEPFFTTKDRGQGTGLGLAIVYGIINQHDGHIAVYSEPNKGTTFTLYLPLAEKATKETVTKTITGTLKTSLAGTETILLAEDERGVREVLTKILEHKGYKVIAAVDGADAIVKYEENKDVIQMLVFDVMMPNKDGKQAYNAIKKTKPDTKILFLSGYADDIVTNRTIHNEGLHFMQKPVNPDKLLRKVREILDAETGTT